MPYANMHGYCADFFFKVEIIAKVCTCEDEMNKNCIMIKVCRRMEASNGKVIFQLLKTTMFSTMCRNEVLELS